MNRISIVTTAGPQSVNIGCRNSEMLSKDSSRQQPPWMKPTRHSMTRLKSVKQSSCVCMAQYNTHHPLFSFIHTTFSLYTHHHGSFNAVGSSVSARENGRDSHSLGESKSNYRAKRQGMPLASTPSGACTYIYQW